MGKVLPKNWVEAMFTEILDINGGTQPPKSQFISEPRDGYIRLLQIRDFGARPVPTYIPDTGKLRTCDKEDILIARYGASIGRIVTGQEGAYNVALAKVNIPKEVDKRYAFHFLNSNSFQSVITSFQRTAQSGFNKNDLSNIPFSLPPLAEQQRIVAKLDALFGHLEQVKTRLANIPQLLKNFRQAILTQAVTGKLTEQWREGKELESGVLLLKKIENSRAEEYKLLCDISEKEKKRKPKKPILKIDLESNIHEEIPDTWIKCHVGDIGEVSNGSTPSRKIIEYWNGEIPWVSSGLVQNGRITETVEYISKTGFENSSVSLLPVGTVLIAMIGEGKTRGQSAILDIEATTNQNIAAVKINHGFVVSEYLQYWFKYRYEANRIAGSGTGPKALNGQKVRELDFILAPLKEQTEIVRRVESLFAKADAIEAKYTTLKAQIDKLPQAILAKAFKGELVEQLDTDGDAKELLEEIKKLKEEEKNKPKPKKKLEQL